MNRIYCLLFWWTSFHPDMTVMVDWLMNVKYAVTKSWSHWIQTGFFHTVTYLCILFTSSHRDADNLQWSVFSPVPTGTLTIFNGSSFLARILTCQTAGTHKLCSSAVLNCESKVVNNTSGTEMFIMVWYTVLDCESKVVHTLVELKCSLWSLASWTSVMHMIVIIVFQFFLFSLFFWNLLLMVSNPCKINVSQLLLTAFSKGINLPLSW